MNNKKKWASILTIATSLILCIISTFGITLAFFGGNASANLSTITLKTGIEIGAAIESSVGTAKVVPGQPITITATGTLSATDKGNPTAANAVDGVVRAKFNIGNDLGDVTISGGEDADVWVKSGDYYYLTEDDQTTLREVTVGESVKIYGTLTVSKNFTNADSGKSVEASVIFETIQADIYKADGTKETLTVTNATTSTSPLYSAFDAVEYKEAKPIYGKVVETVYYNEANITKVTPFSGFPIIQPYAVVSDNNGVYVYYGIELDHDGNNWLGFVNGYPEDSSFYRSVSEYGYIDGYWIRDDEFVVRNVDNYINKTELGVYPAPYTDHPDGYAIMIGYHDKQYSASIIANISKMGYVLTPASSNSGGTN